VSTTLNLTHPHPYNIADPKSNHHQHCNAANVCDMLLCTASFVVAAFLLGHRAAGIQSATLLQARPLHIGKKIKQKEKKRRDYTFGCQFNEKPSIIPGYPGLCTLHECCKSTLLHKCCKCTLLHKCCKCTSACRH